MGQRDLFRSKLFLGEQGKKNLRRNAILPFVVSVFIISMIAIPFVSSSFATSNTTNPRLIFGASGLSGSNFPSSFLSLVTHQYSITAFRMGYDLFTGSNGNQLPKYLNSGATFIYASYDGNQTSDPVPFLKANPQINMFGLTNEPNGCSTGQACQTPEQYATMLIADENAKIQAGISTPLCAFELAGDAGSSEQTYAQAVINDGGAGNFQDACIHIYPQQSAASWSAELKQLSTNLDQMEAIVRVPIFITETSVGAGGTGYYGYSTPVAQAMNGLIQMYGSKPYIKGVFWYDLQNTYSPYALFGQNNQAAPLASTFTSLIESYRGSAAITSSFTSVTLPQPRSNESTFASLLSLFQIGTSSVKDNIMVTAEILAVTFLGAIIVAMRRRVSQG